MPELTEIEERLRQAALRGDELDLRGAADREVRAEVVRDLMLGPVDPRGLRLRGATVVGTLDLDGLRTPVRLRLRDSALPQGLTLRGATLPLLDLGGCSVSGLLADDVVIEGSVLIRRGTTTGLVSFAGARIGGKLDLAGTRMSGGRGPALVADRATIGGDLLLDDAVVSGAAADGAVQLTGTRVAGRLSARRLRATDPAGPALSAANLQVTDTVDLSRGAELRGYGDRGAVRLVGARVGSLSLGRSILHNPAGWALAAHYLDAVGTVYLDRVTATGGLRLSGGRIGGQLDLTESTVDGGGDSALAGTRLHVAQAVVLDGATLRSTGPRATVDLRSVRITGDLHLAGTTLAHSTGTALRLNTATVEGRVVVSDTVVESGAVDYRDSDVGGLYDDPARLTGDVELNGLVYRGLPGRPGIPVGQRLDWLDRMPEYAAQPYRQLSAAYQAAGHEDDARRVLVAQQRRLGRALTGWTGVRHRLFGLTLQYGYQPLRAVAALVAVLGIGIVLFVALSGGTRADPGPGRCPVVDRVGLAIDASVPLVSTGTEDRCKVASATGPGQLLAAAGWVLTLAGWASATLVVAGYSGLVRRR